MYAVLFYPNFIPLISFIFIDMGRAKLHKALTF